MFSISCYKTSEIKFNLPDFEGLDFALNLITNYSCLGQRGNNQIVAARAL